MGCAGVCLGSHVLADPVGAVETARKVFAEASES
jgi:hypothetical protein